MGAGPYKFVSFTPGVELVMEAFDGYWRKTPSVKRLVFKVITDESTRLAALKRGEIDIVYSIRGELAEELQRTPGLTLKPAVIQSPQWVSMLDQWDPKSPWHDRRVRLAANLAIDRKAINQAITLGHSRLTYSIIPSTFDFYWQPPAYPFDPAQAKKLLAEAGYPNGFDAGDYYLDISYSNVQEAIANYLQQVGIRSKLTTRERAAHWTSYIDKKYKNLAYTASGAFGNAATRIETYVVAGGAYVYGSYPDIDSLFKDQAAELDRKKREALLHKIQQLMHEKVMHIPIWELAFINGQGPRVQESGLASHPRPRLLGALRGRAAQGEVTAAWVPGPLAAFHRGHQQARSSSSIWSTWSAGRAPRLALKFLSVSRASSGSSASGIPRSRTRAGMSMPR